MPDNNLKKITIDWKKAAMPAILTMYVIIALFSVYSSGSFLKSQFDKIIRVLGTSDTSQSAKTLDFANYQIVASKIGLPSPLQSVVAQPAQPDPVASTSEINTSTSTAPDNLQTTPSSTAKTAITLDPKIKIYNTTKTSGLAGQLKNSLSASGFKNISAANLLPIMPNTVLRYKENLASSAQIIGIKKSISERYRFSEEVLDPNDDYDVIILIGKN